MAGKRNKKAEVVEEEVKDIEVVEAPEVAEAEKEDTNIIEDQPSVETEVVDMDKKLEETPDNSGLTPLQQYMREKIKNATKD